MADKNPNRADWMTDDQWRCAKLAAEYKYGFHHVTNLRKCGKGVMIDEPSEIATYDFNALTRLVVLGHDNAIRIGVSTDTRTTNFDGYEYEEAVTVVTFHPRKREGEKQFERHPDLESHVAKIRAA